MARKLKKLAKAQKGYVGEMQDLGFMLDPDVAITSSRGVPGGQPQYQAIIYYDPNDRDGYFTSDLERMIPELNERYGAGNWIAKGLPKTKYTDAYQTLYDENEANSYLKQTREKRKEIQNQISPISQELWNRRKGLEGYDEADYDPESKEIIELENKLKRLEKEEKELVAKLQPLTYSDQDYYYNVNQGAFKLLDNALFDNEDHRNYILNEIKLSELQDQGQQYLSSERLTNEYFQDIKNLSPTGDIIIMQHGTGKVGPIMLSEEERKGFNYTQTPGITDTFSELINETFDDPSGITCYMGMCRQSDSGERLADATGMKVNVASGTQWSGYQPRFGDTFIDRFFGPGVPRPDAQNEAAYGYDTYDGSGLIVNKNYGGDIDYGITPNASDTFSGYSNQTAPPMEIISDADYAAQQRQDLINQAVASNKNQGIIYSKNQQNLDRLKKSNSLVALYSGLKNTYDALTEDGKYGGSLPKLQPGGKAGLVKYGINALKYTPKTIRPDLLKFIRTNNRNLDLRGINQTFDFNPQLIGVNELNLKGIDFKNLTDYEKAVISNINQPDFQPVGNFADLAKNYSQFNVDKNFAINAANMAVDLKEINPDFYIELLTKGKPSPFMNEIFADPRIPIFNARNPVVGNQPMNWDRQYEMSLRDNFTNEFEKNLRSYGKYGFYASGVPLQGATSFQRLTSTPKNIFGNNYYMSQPFGKNVSYLQEPSYQYIDINTPVADYVVNAGLMNVDPITNLATFRGRGEMANQHNFLLGRTNSPSLILSGDEGFANTFGGNTIRKNIAGIDTPGRGKNVLDINSQIAPLLTEKFSLTTPFEGTFMKFPRFQTYRRKTDGTMPRKSFIRDSDGYEFNVGQFDYKAFVEDPNMPLLGGNLTREEFNLLDPFKKRQYFDEQGILFDPLKDLYKKEGGALPKAQSGKERIALKLADNFFSGFNNMIKKKPFLPVKQFDKFLLKNFNKGEAMFIQNTLKNNPSLISNNQIDLSKLKEQSFSDLAVTNHAFQPILNNLDARMIDGTQGFRSKWTGMESSDGADFGLYRYPDLLPSQFSYLPGGFTEFKGTRITPTNYSVSMPNLLKKPYLDEHHDGLHILDPLAMGWVRGFVDAENPGLFILKELQTDINKDPMFNFLSNKNRSELLKVKPQIEKRNDKYFSNLNDINNKINNIQQRKNEIFGLDEFADEYNALDIQQQELARLAETGKNLYPTSRRIIDNSDLSLQSLIPMSRIGSKPYYRFENETLNFLQDAGFNKIVIPDATSISNIQGWNAMDGLTKSQKGTLGYYSNLQKNPQLINTGNTYGLDNYSGTIFDLQRKPYNPFKEYGGQTEGYALDDTPDPLKYKVGGQTYNIKQYQNGNEVPSFDDEYDNFRTFIQEEETSWDYVKNKDSAVLKPDGKTYYKIYEDGMFYPYYHQNADGSYENQATIGFGRKGPNIYNDYKSGVGLEQAEKWKDEDIDNALRKTKIYIDANYGENSYDNLPDRTKFMLADYTYNLGKLSKYPKFADAIMTNNIDKALAEYIRNDEKGGSPLARNEGYLMKYLQPWIDNINKEELERQKANLKMMQELQNQTVIPADNTMVGTNPFGGFKDGGQLAKAQMYNSETPSFGQIALALERRNKLYEPYGGYENFTTMDDFNTYQGYLKAGDIEIANVLFPQFANMDFGDYYGQTRDNLTMAQNTNSPFLISNLGNKAGNNFEFTYKGEPYHPYSYEEIASPKFTEVMQLIDAELKKDNNMFKNRGDLLAYINKQFPEGSKERAYINYQKSVQDGINTLVSGYDNSLPELINKDKTNINLDFNKLYNQNNYLNNLNAIPADNTNVVTNQVNFNDIQKLNNNRSNQTFIGPDTRTSYERQRDAENMKAYKQYEETMAKGIPPNMMFLYQSAPAFQGASGYERAVEDYNYNPFSAFKQIEMVAGTVLPFKGVGSLYTRAASTPLNVLRQAPTKLKNIFTKGKGSLPSTTVRSGSINPVTGRPLTFGDLANVGWGTNAAVNTFPNAITDFQEGNIGSGLANTAFGAFEVSGVPSSLLRGYKTLPDAAKIFGSGNIVPTNTAGLLKTYPNLKYNENIGMFNTSLNNPSISTFKGINPEFTKVYDDIIGPNIGNLPLFKPYPFYKGPTQSQFRSILRNQ